MILKVLQPDTGKWFYYDKICLFKHKYEEIHYPLPPLREDEISLLPLDDVEPTGGRIFATYADLNFLYGAAKTVIFNGDAYLLNDEGKTIERL